MAHFSFHNNNFDLIRLLAALQVAWLHATHHLGVTGTVTELLKIVPGVPIFFIVSGFLVSASLERSTLYDYTVKRFLRIYPALWVCFGAGVLSVVWFGDLNASLFDFSVWAGAQLTIGQFYNPDFLRDYGVGVLNGSLWTIPVELQFYIALPFILMILRSNQGIFALICLSAVLNQIFLQYKGGGGYGVKLIGVTVLPYLYMFLLGVLLQRNLNFVARYLAGRFMIWFPLYLVSCVAFNYLGLRITGNGINPISAVLLGLTVISAAYTRPTLKNILGGNDISYGLYIYHMIVVNALISLGYQGGFTAVSAIVISLWLAYFSWVLVERPALRMKHRLVRNPSVVPNALL